MMACISTHPEKRLRKKLEKCSQLGAEHINNFS